MSSPSFTLPSGLSFSLEEAESRLERFCREEFAYYDAIVDLVPSRIEPIDVIVTKSMNSRVNEADRIRSVHRGLAGRCDSLLPRIPVNADLLTYDPELNQFRELIHAAVQSPGVMIAGRDQGAASQAAQLCPHDRQLRDQALRDGPEATRLDREEPIKATAAAVAVEVAKAFREDLRHAMPHIAAIRTSLANAGFDLSPVRILEILIWTQIEPNGYYRTG